MTAHAGDFIRQAMKVGMLPYAAFTQQVTPGVMILVYHRVGGSDVRQLNLSRELFEWQMGYLARVRQVVSLDEVVSIVETGRSFPNDVVAITFDDGYEDVYHHAFPILARYQLPATVYVSTQFVDEGRPFQFHPNERHPAGKALRWDQIREMAGTGLVTFGAHTHSHADLTTLRPEQIADELSEANRLIAEYVGVPPAHFAYPWGRASEATRNVVARTYRTAAGGMPQKNVFGEIDLTELRRVPIQRSDGKFFFRLKLDSWRIPAPSTVMQG